MLTALNRLREEIEQLSAENLGKLRHAEEEKSALLSAQYRTLDELEKSKSLEINRQRERHREEVERMKQDHLSAIDLYVLILICLSNIWFTLEQLFLQTLLLGEDKLV